MIEKIHKYVLRGVSFFLCGFLGVSSVACSYTSVSAAVVPVTYGIAEFVLALLASTGTVYMTQEMMKGDWTDGSGALMPEADDIYEDMRTSYNEQWKLKYGGGGTDPEEPKPPEDFEDILNTALIGGVMEFSQEAWDLMKYWYEDNVSNAYALGGLLYDTLKPDKMNPDLGHVGKDTQAVLYGNGLVSGGLISGPVTIVLNSNIPCAFYNSGQYTYLVYAVGIDGLGAVKSESYYGGPVGSYSKQDGWNIFYGNIGSSAVVAPGIKLFAQPLLGLESRFSKHPVLKDFSACYYYIQSELGEDSNENKPPIWVTPELQDSFDRTGKLEYPQQAPQPLHLPTADQMAELAPELNPDPAVNPDYDPDAVPEIVKKFIESLQVKPNPDPDPDKPIDPDKPVDPDNPGSSDTGDIKDYLADLKTLFPFCIPFDLIHFFEVLNAEPEAPVFTLKFNFDKFDIHESITLDFADFEDVVKIVRICILMTFCLGLIIVTRNVIRG